MKKMFISLMILAIIFGAVVPNKTFAQPKEDSIKNITFSNWIRTLGSQYPLLKSYGIVILKQPNLNVEKMNSLNNNQQIARNNVREWLDEYGPKMIEINESLNGLTQRVDQYYMSLYTSQINDLESRYDFLNRINRLQDSIEQIQYDMERTSSDLNAYTNLLINDANNFTEKATKAIESLSGSSGEALKLKEQLNSLLKEIQEELLKIVSNPDEVYDFSFKLGQQLFNLVKTGAETKTVEAATVEALGKEIMNAKDPSTKKSALIIKNKQEKVVDLIKKLSDIERQATNIAINEDQILGFTELVKRESTIFNQITEQVKNLNSIVQKLQTDVIDENINQRELQKQLKYFKTLMDDVQKQTKQFESFTTLSH
ncbi:hypothetical protein CAI16_04050 [Virgibacillus dokdonensis]|uniref:Hemolytic enterotoxin (HBL) n=1 Tax=Virgibacillus dokdonensis TaxID=302167 RepID=A0A3E0WUQ7_9BACI|nr:HBL/NHE enterotoxin family protein [Virgibacillus dokdonensis]RFA36568.1 hypothetical protein CAI16_04050 [Virgibacillus dokdonensis]